MCVVPDGQLGRLRVEQRRVVPLVVVVGAAQRQVELLAAVRRPAGPSRAVRVPAVDVLVAVRVVVLRVLQAEVVPVRGGDGGGGSGGGRRGVRARRVDLGVLELGAVVVALLRNLLQLLVQIADLVRKGRS